MKHFKSLFSSILVVSTILLLGSCNKNNPKSTKWWIYEYYRFHQGEPGSIQSLALTGPDQILDFRNDGTIYYSQKNVAGSKPTYWGIYTDSTITLGSGGVNSVEYNIVSMDARLINAQRVDTTTVTGNTMINCLTLKR